MEEKRKKGISAVLVISRRAQIIGFVLLIALIFYAVNCPAIVGVTATTRLLPIYSVETESKKVALTFNAAWDNEDIEELIDILDRYGLKVTFFVVGDWVDKYPKSLKALSDAGHEIMNHSDSHAHYASLGTDEIIADVNACNDKVEEITGKRPTMFRAPYGEYDDHVIAAVNSMGMYAIQWDVDSLDWKNLSAAEITERVISRAVAGSIVLFHSGAENTPEALPDVLDYLLGAGYEIVPVSELIIKDNYTIDHTGRQKAIG